MHLMQVRVSNLLMLCMCPSMGQIVHVKCYMHFQGCIGTEVVYTCSQLQYTWIYPLLNVPCEFICSYHNTHVGLHQRPLHYWNHMSYLRNDVILCNLYTRSSCSCLYGYCVGSPILVSEWRNFKCVCVCVRVCVCSSQFIAPPQIIAACYC